MCGADFLGAHLEGADLTGTLLPLVSDRFMQIGADTFDCPEITVPRQHAAREERLLVHDPCDCTLLTCINGTCG